MTDPAAQSSLDTEFVGRRPRLFRLSFLGAIWTLLTFGFYRFWMKTRLRRWYWSAVRPGGLPLEYVGDPVEKLLGFFMAVVVLAFYIGIVNLVLMFLSLSLLSSNFTAYAASLIGVIPIWFYARYRARRYVLARTRWRGVRFGLEPGAWGYAGRALWHWAVTILSFGALWPRKTFFLEKYLTDRTLYGSQKLNQGGDWVLLVPAFAHVYVSGAITWLCALGLIYEHLDAGFVWIFALSVPWFIYGVIHYTVEAKRILTGHKSAGAVRAQAAPQIGVVARIYIFGYLATALTCLIPVSPIIVAVGAVETARITAAYDPNLEGGLVLGLPVAVWSILGAAAYVMVMLIWSSLRHCFVVMPLWRHYAQTLTLENTDALTDIGQKSRDDFQEAEGFAEALDLWGAI